MLVLFLGILLPVGTEAVSFGIILGAIIPKSGEKRAATASGFVNASSGAGSTVFSPMIQKLFSSVGLKDTMLALGLAAVILIPVSLLVSGSKGRRSIESGSHKNTNVPALLRRALKRRNFLFLLPGFTPRGFHMAIIETHPYSQTQSYDMTDSAAALAFSAYGFASVLGSLASGFLSGRLPMEYVVGALYGNRAARSSPSSFCSRPRR